MKSLYSLVLLTILALTACAQSSKKAEFTMKFKELTPMEKHVIVDKGTERPFTGEYNDFFEEGTYTCKRCGAELYKSEDKFSSHCGWPSFDDEIPGKVKHTLDTDGRRTEITCAACGAHLGHVFHGEGFTNKNTRHCVNSISLEFIPKKAIKESNSDTAIFAAGCFWGVEYNFQQTKGVIATRVGYTGGHTKNPSYRDVCSHTTGHAEAVQVIFNPDKVSYEELVELFFQLHDPTQKNRQGPDVGTQYRSAIFYLNEHQKMVASDVIDQLNRKKGNIATEVTKASQFWPAETYHQDYYGKKGIKPSCAIH